MNEEERKEMPIENPTTEVQPTVLPTETEEPAEEPVMIADNIDEMSTEELASITTSVPMEPANEVTPVETPPVELPTEMPDLGNPEESKEDETIPAFQNLPTPDEEVPLAETEQPVEEAEKPKEEVEMLVEEEKTSFAEIPTSLVDMYQAKPTNEPTASTPPTSEEMKPTEEYDEEENEDTPKRKRRVFPLIIIGIVLVAVIVVGVMGLQTRGRKGPIDMLRPKRSADSNINYVVLGDTNTPNAQVIATILKKMGTEKTVEELQNCPEKETYQIKYNLHVLEIKSNDNTYNLNYACGLDSSIKYLLVSEGDQTVDGAIIVISASSGITSEINTYIHTLSKIGINKVVVYIIEDGDATKAEEDIKAALDANNMDSTNTPIVKGTATDEEKMETLVSKADKWIQKEDSYQQPMVVLSVKTIHIFTNFLTESESIDDLIFTINKKDYNAKVSLEEGHEKIQAGDKQEITIELEEGIPAITGMRVMIKNGDTLIGIGVISEVK